MGEFLHRFRFPLTSILALLACGGIWWLQQEFGDPTVQTVLAVALGVTGGVLVWSLALLAFGWLTGKAKR